MLESVPPLDTIAFIGFVILFVCVAWASAVRPRYALAVLIVCVAFPLTHGIGMTTITTGKIALLATFLGLAMTDFRALLPTRRLAWPLAALLAIFLFDLISSRWASYPHAAIQEAGKWFEYALLMVSSSALWRRDPDFNTLRKTVEYSTLAVIATAIVWEFVAPVSYVHIGVMTFVRLSGTLEGPNQLGDFLVMATALLTYYTLLDANRRSQIILASCLIAVGLTFSRTALVSAMIAVVILAWYHRAYMRRLVAPIVAAILVLFSLLVVAVKASHSASITHFMARPNAEKYAGGVGTRAELWHAAFTLWSRHPLLGIGANNFTFSLASVGLPLIRTHANNFYLEALADGGVVLLGLSLLMLVAMLIATWKRGSGIATAAIMAFIAAGLLDNPWYTPAVIAWWCITIAISAFDR